MQSSGSEERSTFVPNVRLVTSYPSDIHARCKWYHGLEHAVIVLTDYKCLLSIVLQMEDDGDGRLASRLKKHKTVSTNPAREGTNDSSLSITGNTPASPLSSTTYHLTLDCLPPIHYGYEAQHTGVMTSGKSGELLTVELVKHLSLLGFAIYLVEDLTPPVPINKLESSIMRAKLSPAKVHLRRATSHNELYTNKLSAGNSQKLPAVVSHNLRSIRAFSITGEQNRAMDLMSSGGPLGRFGELELDLFASGEYAQCALWLPISTCPLLGVDTFSYRLWPKVLLYP
ncbi:hypothetical protein F2P81_019768 [Scomber scombrus]|uniref:Uncharacterized protein n=1 Tax=Scomber scombrus TaxID=13677 RepID=A0AAV1PC49_SCOSC